MWVIMWSYLIVSPQLVALASVALEGSHRGTLSPLGDVPAVAATNFQI